MVALSKTPGAPAIGQAQRERAAAEIRDIAKHPAVAAVLQQFPDAQVTSVRPLPGTADRRHRHGLTRRSSASAG